MNIVRIFDIVEMRNQIILDELFPLHSNGTTNQRNKDVYHA